MEEAAPQSAPENQPDLDFAALVQIYWRNRKLVSSTIIISLIVAVFYLHFAEYEYTAELRLTTVQQDSSGFGELGGLASLAGIGMPKESFVSPFTLFIQGIDSRQTADELAQDRAIMRILFEDQWDEPSSRWKDPGGILQPIRILVDIALGVPKQEWQPPSGADVERHLSESLEVVEDFEDPIVVIRYSHQDPVFAGKFLERLYNITDEFIRSRTLSRTEEYVKYLTIQLSTATVLEHRQAIAAKLIGQEELRMMANSGLAFSAAPFGPIAISARPTKPQPLLVLLVGLIGGLGLSLVLLGFRHAALTIRQLNN